MVLPVLGPAAFFVLKIQHFAFFRFSPFVTPRQQRPQSCLAKKNGLCSRVLASYPLEALEDIAYSSAYVQIVGTYIAN